MNSLYYYNIYTHYIYVKIFYFGRNVYINIYYNYKIYMWEREGVNKKKKEEKRKNDEWREKVVSVINEGIENYYFAK